jgi:hypothetical protein
MNAEELRRARREMWAEGHCCSNWFDCVMCLERKAEIDKQYPPVAETEAGNGRTVEREATEVARDAGGEGATDYGVPKRPKAKRPSRKPE